MVLLPAHDFVTSCIGHLENIDPLSFSNVPNTYNGLFYNTKKITFFCYIISQLISSDSIDIKNLSNSSGRLRFSILFFARKLSCYHLQQKLSFVFLEVVGSLHSFFSGKYLPNTHILITIIYVSLFFFFWVKMVFHGGKKHMCSSLRQRFSLGALIWSPSKWKRHGFKGQDLIKLAIFLFLKNILQWNCSSLHGCASEKWNDPW